jgi:HAD superfamily hydrolase (TIGR01509 family)
LVRTDELHYRSWKLVADRRGWRFDRATFDLRMRGLPRPDATSVFLMAAGAAPTPALATQVAREKQALFLSLVEAEPLRPEEGALELLAALERRQVPVAVGSSSRNVSLVLRNLGLAARFRAIVGGGDLPGKPDPAIFLEAARRLAVPPPGCIVVEDAADGVKAAVAAGMQAAAIGPAQRFAGLPIVIRVDRLAQLDAETLLACRG